MIDRREHLDLLLIALLLVRRYTVWVPTVAAWPKNIKYYFIAKCLIKI